ncbi:hypothetical protein ACTQ54_11350 [Fundicoccus sp. Sow4_H7]|uniref:hypothetical protein n=1 Tax=Fundicoccus sp. Sow4_H7 TaxID=3438784 RepID=UPI003F8F1630
MLNKINRLMAGRYGIDQLYTALAVVFVLLQFIQLFLQTPLINIASIALLAWMTYRIFSKNITGRQQENQKYLMIKNKFLKQLWVRKARDIRSHRYRECPECHKTLRLPRKTGTHTVVCPTCKERFEVTIRI